jgi:hypothetical protein
MNDTSDDPAFKALRYRSMVKDAGLRMETAKAEACLCEIESRVLEDGLCPEDKRSILDEIGMQKKRISDAHDKGGTGLGITGRDVLVAGVSGVVAAYAINKLRSYVECTARSVMLDAIDVARTGGYGRDGMEKVFGKMGYDES